MAGPLQAQRKRRGAAAGLALCVGLLGGLAGCESSPEESPERGGARREQLGGGETEQYRFDDPVGGLEREATLRRQPDGDYYVERLTPATVPHVQPSDVRWLYAYVPPAKALVLSSGQRLAHPDQEASRDLLATAEAGDVAGALRRLPTLHRRESRAAVLSELVEPDLVRRTAVLDAMIALDAPAPGGPPAGGDPDFNRMGVLLEVIDAGDTEPLAARLLSEVLLIGNEPQRSQLLVSLVPVARWESLLAAADDLEDSSSRARVLKALAESARLEDEANVLLRRSPRLLDDGEEAKLIELLIPKAGFDDLLAATNEVSRSDLRLFLLLRLADQRLTSEEQAAKLLRAGRELHDDDAEARLFAARPLAATASFRDLLRATGGFGHPGRRGDALLAIARGRPNLTPGEADALLSEAFNLPSVGRQLELLELLEERATLPVMLTLTQQIEPGRRRFPILLRLTARPDLTQPDADAILEQAYDLGGDSRAVGELVRALIDKASDNSLRAAIETIKSRRRREELLALLN